MGTFADSADGSACPLARLSRLYLFGVETLHQIENFLLLLRRQGHELRVRGAEALALVGGLCCLSYLSLWEFQRQCQS